jgi:hypothetical protein
VQTTHANTRRRVASVRGSRRHVRWPDRIHRGSQVVCAASFGLALVAAVRYDRAHTADGSSTGAFVPLLLTALIGILALAVVLFRPERGEFRRHVATAATWSVALVLTLAVVWAHINLAVSDVRSEAAVRLPVLSQAGVDAFLAAHLDPPAVADPPPYQIPTGVLLESVEFLSANNVRVSGYVWQKWPPGVAADITRGFALPEAVDMADPGDPAYTATEADGATLIGWRVQATLRQAFDYRLYPFDRQDVSLRLWARDLDRRVVLVPDFASYPSLDPAALPGLDRQFVYGGWTPVHAHFSYGATRNDATMGYTAAKAAGFPELYFNVGLKREFLEPFLDYVIFALVVAMLLFGVLVLTVKDEASKNRIGISTFSVLGTSGTLLFAVILRESQLRSTIDPDQIVYLETLPLLLNLAILMVALNAILHSAPLNRGRAQPGYRFSHLPTLIYWPALLGALLAVTLVVFYQ